MKRTKIAGLGKYLPAQRVSNHDLSKYMDTTDEWIQERTGIQERRFAQKHKETTTTMGAAAARQAIERAGIAKEDVDFIVFATLSPDYYFPGCGVLVQRELGITGGEIPALDIRNQCSGFIYGLEVVDQFIKTGKYKNILFICSEMQSMGLDFSTEGRGVSVIFGDGAAALVCQPTDEDGKGVITTHIHSDGTHAEELALLNPGCHGGYHVGTEPFGYPDPNKFGGMFVTQKMLNDNMLSPHMNGQLVFKHAVTKFPAVINEALTTAGYIASDINMFIPHQANLRISQFVQKRLGLEDSQVYNNIQKYGNTTAASIPIAMCEAWEEDLIKDGDLVCMAAFGSGFTWGAGLLRW